MDRNNWFGHFDKQQNISNKQNITMIKCGLQHVLIVSERFLSTMADNPCPVFQLECFGESQKLEK